MRAAAQQPADATPAPKTEVRRQLEKDLMCTCGACRAPMGDCQMRPACHGYREQSAKIDAYLAQGMTRDQILAAFVKDYGGEDVLTSPIDRGFNRLAWAFPYLLGAAGALVIAAMAFRWSRRDGSGETIPALPSGSASLEARLDDELRDLD
jgi:hypothetical protein